jgi:hypothetical protein
MKPVGSDGRRVRDGDAPSKFEGGGAAPLANAPPPRSLQERVPQASARPVALPRFFQPLLLASKVRAIRAETEIPATAPKLNRSVRTPQISQGSEGCHPGGSRQSALRQSVDVTVMVGREIAAPWVGPSRPRRTTSVTPTWVMLLVGGTWSSVVPLEP